MTGSPIVINGLSHSGTNIAVNLVLSHPDVCYPGETHKALKGGTKSHDVLATIHKRARYEILRLLRGLDDIADVYRSTAASKWHGEAATWLKEELLREKRLAKHESHNLYKARNEFYSEGERDRARLLLKNNNALCFDTELFRLIWGDIRFVGLLRHPFAVVESHIRRGRKPEKIIPLFTEVVRALLDDAERMPNHFRLIRYEDMLRRPRDVMMSLYEYLDLDLRQVPNVRLQHKATVQRDGTSLNRGRYDRQVVWYRSDNFGKHFDPEVNLRQIERLHPSYRDAVWTHMGKLMTQAGYRSDAPYVEAPAIPTLG